MCGITGAVAQRDISPILLEGLKRLEYRGYDSAGMAVLNEAGQLERLRICGKVNQLSQAHDKEPLLGKVGIAHTRWATHGKPSENNAHPHMFQNKIALVHNGIIENYLPLREALLKQGVEFQSETDSEVIVQWIGMQMESSDLLTAMQSTMRELQGAYALVVVSHTAPDRIIAARHGAPLVIGLGVGENFVASDSLALLPFTQDFVILEDGDVAEIFRDHYQIYDRQGVKVERKVRKIALTVQSTDRGKYRHYMQKEIFEQPEAIRSCLAGRLHENDIPDAIFGANASEIFDRTRAVQIVACGTSYHAGLVAKYWIEQIVGIPCQVEVASEVRYRRVVINPGTLFVALSQSGETADTLAAIRGLISDKYCGKLAICNVPESSLVREADLVLLTHAGPEIGVASTKAFSTQLIALLMLVQCLGRRNDNEELERHQIVPALRALPQLIEQVLQLDEAIAKLAHRFDGREHALFIGRGIHYPIVKEGALKLKEISYIHAEAYSAGELKHGPLALVDKHMPVVALAAHDHLLDKLTSNLQEVRARQGELIVLAERGTELTSHKDMTVIEIPQVGELLAPMTFSVLLQLLAYHVAVIKGTDVDQPRNLAKSVTVE
ncbi:MAG: glutamine--fructose-6-phosphate aminotransferase [Gammaproteobacteria bacterium 39-13]|nr:glutamine--fructose-6-phosphate transaminase (isomerizing) [Gammaproteobacteria bacterium]OJV86213.1 MAG: glutamine--fructose-6-phosphate aminotransferase [Gammaproteobacteria bacterium 39-13]